MIEVSLALTVLLVALIAMTASNVRTQALHRSTHERGQAHNAVRAIAERVQSVAREGLDSTMGWSPYVYGALTAGGEIGRTFDVPGLVPVDGDASIGTIEVVLDETSTDASVGTKLGLPRDLNGDGDAVDPDVRANAKLIPVIVRARWRSPSGTQSIAQPLYVFGG